MYGRKVKLRFFFIALIIVVLSLTVFLILKSLEENIVYFQSPSDIKEVSKIEKKKKIRIGGMVKNDSIIVKEKEVKFIADNAFDHVISNHLYKHRINDLIRSIE